MSASKTEPHHRLPKSLGGTDDPSNISLVTIGKHAAWHMIYQNHTPVNVIRITNTVWLDPAYVLIISGEGLPYGADYHTFILPLDEDIRRRIKNKSRHHRRPKSLGGGFRGNISEVEQKEHAAWHILFSNKTPPEIAEEMNEFYLPPTVKVRAVRILQSPAPDTNEACTEERDFNYPCPVCGEHYKTEKGARFCKKKGLIAPRYECGERVLISIPKKEPQEGVITGWHHEASANPHTYEFYTVKLDGGGEVGVFAWNLQVKTRKGAWIKRGQVTVKNRHKLDRWLHRKGF